MDPIERRDDRLLAPTRWTATGIIPILAAAFLVLFLRPGQTERWWAWTVKPELTPMIMGGGYLAGAFLFLRVRKAREWHTVGHAFPAISLFTAVLLAATLLHWDRFNHDHPSFWLWLALYVVTPVLLPWLWVRNRRTDPGPAPGEVAVPRPVRMAIGAIGAGQLGLAGLMLVRPAWAVDNWPWQLTPLTARTLSAFIAFPAVIWLTFLLEERWSALQVPVEVVLVGLVTIVVSVARRWDDLEAGPGSPGLYMALLLATLAGVGALRVAMGRASVPGTPAPTPPAPAPPAPPAPPVAAPG